MEVTIVLLQEVVTVPITTMVLHLFACPTDFVEVKATGKSFLSFTQCSSAARQLTICYSDIKNSVSGSIYIFLLISIYHIVMLLKT